MADAKAMKQAKDIVLSDKSRRYVIVSANVECGKPGHSLDRVKDLTGISSVTSEIEIAVASVVHDRNGKILTL